MAIKKRVALSVISAVIFAALFPMALKYEKRFYIQTPFGPVLIPTEIVQSKNCIHYRKYAESLTYLGFLSDARCPFIRPRGSTNITIADTTLSIPREYFGYDAFKMDGRKDAVFLLFHYPDMGPIINEADHQKSISVLLEGMDKISPAVAQKKVMQDFLTKVFRIDSRQHITNSVKSETVLAPQSKEKVNDTEFKTYRLTVDQGEGEYSEVKDVFFAGPYNNPTKWFVCDQPVALQSGISVPMHPRCQTKITIDGDRLFAKVSYPRTFQDDHERIENLVRKKIQSFARH